MSRKLLLLATLLLPITALAALDFTTHTAYKDVRGSSPEAAGVAMLTNMGVIKGYEGGYFGPARKVNRAEFLKIALLSAPTEKIGPIPAGSDCFIDVHKRDWFSPYVCLAKDKGIVSGYQSPSLPRALWQFRPAQEVSYAEALKMLEMIHGYTVDSDTHESWQEPYYRSARARGVDLPVSLELDSTLTRALTVRLVAAFVAESQGMLTELRYAESGKPLTSSSSLSESPASSVSSSASSASSSPASAPSSSSPSSVAQSSFTIPARSHFLTVGAKSDAIADGTIPARPEAQSVRAAEIKLLNEVPAVNVIELVTDNGTVIATLKKRTTNDVTDYKKFYEIQVAPELAASIPADASLHVNARAVVRGLNDYGASDQLLQVLSFKMTTYGMTTTSTFTTPIPSPFPAHQTSFGSLNQIRNAGPASGKISSGASVLLGMYSFAGTVVAGKQLAVESLVFTLTQSGTVSIANPRLVKPGGASQQCGTNPTGMSCSAIPQTIGLIDSSQLTLQVYADVSTSDLDHTSFSLDLKTAGLPGDGGDVQWTDLSGRFKWVERVSPIARGTIWKP